MGLEPADLARFAAEGGIRKCVAESSDDLMFLKGCCGLDPYTYFA